MLLRPLHGVLPAISKPLQLSSKDDRWIFIFHFKSITEKKPALYICVYIYTFKKIIH